MKRLLVFLAAGALMLPLSARTIREEIAETPEKAGGVYYAYPVQDIDPVPEVPKGYTPFYVSHYGRHGSRHVIKDFYYKHVRDRLGDAAEKNALTPDGLRVKAMVDTMWEEACGRLGELSPLGARQQRGIGRRLGLAYPQIFADTLADVTATSTVVMRCAHSMFAFVEGLKELYPYLDIPRESAQRQMDYMNYQSQESRPYRTEEGPWLQPFKRISRENMQPDRLINSLFSDSEYVAQWVDKENFTSYLFWLAVAVQNMETDVDLLQFFTNDELYKIWEINNFENFSRTSSYAPANGMHLSNARNLVRNIITTADGYIASGKHGATLRFGHDSNIIPLTALLAMEGCFSDAVDPFDLAPGGYANFYVSPMASNVQLVFFRNDKKPDDILVRVMLNERDVRLMPLKQACKNYYRWSDLRPYLESLLTD